MKLFKCENENTGESDIIAAFDISEIPLLKWTRITELKARI